MCEHSRKIGDNYGESCADCREQLSGYGYGGWFGTHLTGQEKCIHLWSPAGDRSKNANYEVCIYCQEWRKRENTS